MTIDTRVLNISGWIDLSAEQPDDSPHCALGAQGCGPVTEGHRGIQVRAAIPFDREIRGLSDVDSEPPIPPGKVQFEHLDLFTGVQAPTLFDESNNCLGGWKR